MAAKACLRIAKFWTEAQKGKILRSLDHVRWLLDGASSSAAIRAEGLMPTSSRPAQREGPLHLPSLTLSLTRSITNLSVLQQANKHKKGIIAYCNEVLLAILSIRVSLTQLVRVTRDRRDP